MVRRIRKKSTPPPPVVEKPQPTVSFWRDYPRIVPMFVLLLFLPPLGWLFTYKYSPYDKKTSALIATVCTFFFVYAVFISPAHEWVDVSKFTQAEFVSRYNQQAKKLAPRLGLNIDEEKISVDGKIFQYSFTDNLAISAQVNANDFVDAVTITAEPKNTDDSFQAINSFGLVVATLNPELDVEDRGEILRELQMLEGKMSEDSNATTVSGRITYGVSNTSGKIIFTARVE